MLKCVKLYNLPQHVKLKVIMIPNFICVTLTVGWVNLWWKKIPILLPELHPFNAAYEIAHTLLQYM